jgi:hypothetical protein
MKQRLFWQLLLGLAITLPAFAQAPVLREWRDAQPNVVTLFARPQRQNINSDSSVPPNPGYGRSAFSFQFGLRSDAGTSKTHNDWELEYGGLNWNGDTDWFNVTMVVDDRSRIKDLGALQWSDIAEVPILPAGLKPAQGKAFRTASLPAGVEESTNGQMTRVVLGHVYVVHSKDGDSDFYTLFRVEELVPSTQVTISWKNVPSPESPR